MTKPLRILAFSDLHGRCYPEAAALIETHQPDWIVLCGDLLPDFSRIGGRGNRLEAQRDFWRAHRRAFLRKGAVTTLVRGNHEIEGLEDPDLLDLPARVRREVVRLEGIPVEYGAWGFSREWVEDDLMAELEAQLLLRPEPRIYLSHVPPYGCLDLVRSGNHIGHKPLFRHLRRRDWPEALVLCGHVHESFGSLGCGETLVVNMACGYALVEWNLGTTALLAQARLAPGGAAAGDV